MYKTKPRKAGDDAGGIAVHIDNSGHHPYVGAGR